MDNQEKYLAEQFILHTDRNIFLTGKAGTGKTTLLHEILEKTDKNAVVVAPTGVAAINAGGMTIHSTFQFPTTAFVPTDDFVDPELATNRKQLANKQKIRKERIQLLLELELLIIDEISMVRADLLDAIDYTLRRLRRNAEPFGGVQLLAIGDLFQLAPVVKQKSWPLLSQYYHTPFFFGAQAWQKSMPIIIELQKVYRQEDPVFVGILNRIRIGQATSHDINRLNQNYQKEVDTKIIHLTTHNHSADQLNQSQLDAIDAPEIKLHAQIYGSFYESAYPLPEVMTFKKGCQVMFVRNHSAGLYYNGKIGTFIGMIDDEIMVKGLEDGNTIYVSREEWKNTRYKVGEDKKVVTEDIGTFEQYPIRLAWAITVHKSQGLTFDEVAVDLSRSFAPGQLYVALSRCRSLNGLTLTSHLKAHNVMVDRHISQYYQQAILDDSIHNELDSSKKQYQDKKLIRAFSIDKLILYMDVWEEDFIREDYPMKADIVKVHKEITNTLFGMQETVVKFENLLYHLLSNSDVTAIKERSEKAIIYFTDKIHEGIMVVLDEHIKKCKKTSGLRKYTKLIKEIREEFWIKINKLYTLHYNEQPLHPDSPRHRQVEYFDPDAKPKKKKVKGETYDLTLKLFQSGKTLEEIAKDRGLAVSTIETHIGRLIKEEKIEIEAVMKKKKINKIIKYIEGDPDATLTELRGRIPFEVSYGELRWVKSSISDYT